MIEHQNRHSHGNYNYRFLRRTDAQGWTHFHRALELVYVISGTLHAAIDTDSFQISAGEYALFLSNQVHSVWTEAKSESWIAIFGEEFVPHFASIIKNKQGQRATFRLSDATHRFVQQQIAEADPSIMMRKACFYAVCDEYLSQVQLCDRKSSDIKIGKIFDYIAEHYKEDLTLESVAKEFGYEYHYLSRLLNKTYQFNFRQTLNEYRIEAAKELLDAGGKRISEVALECGFQSIRSFNDVFKRITGCSPNAYVKDADAALENGFQTIRSYNDVLRRINTSQPSENAK